DDNFTIRNLASYRDSFTHLFVDGDVTPFDGILSIVRLNGDTYDDELRIQSNGASPFNWLFGGEVYHSEYDAQFPTYFRGEVGEALSGPNNPFFIGLFNSLLAGTISANTIDGESDVWSVFGEVSYLFWDRLELVLRARYDDIDSKVVHSAAGAAGTGGAG